MNQGVGYVVDVSKADTLPGASVEVLTLEDLLLTSRAW